MVYCKIKQCLPNNVYVIEAFSNKVELVLEFYGMDSPRVGDCLVLHKNLLDNSSPNFTQPYCFEVGDKRIVRENDLDEETAILRSGGKFYVLKRIYG